MTRGDLVVVAYAGDYGKPRPALIVQSDAHGEHHSVTVLPLTSELHDLPLMRVTIEATAESGLLRRSQVMVDKAVTVPRTKVGDCIGRLDTAALSRVNQVFAAFLDLA